MRLKNFLLKRLTVLSIICTAIFFAAQTVLQNSLNSPEDFQKSLPKIFYQGLTDKWMRHKSHLFVATGSKWKSLSESRQVCLATHTSIEMLYWLLTTLQSWSGPISVAIFTPDVEYDISVRYIHYLQRCFPKVRQQVSFHFVQPLAHPMKESKKLSALLSGTEVSCEEDPKEFLNLLLSFKVKYYQPFLQCHEKFHNIVYLKLIQFFSVQRLQ